MKEYIFNYMDNLVNVLITVLYTKNIKFLSIKNLII